MPTPESKVKEAVKKLLKKFGVYYHMPVQAAFGKPSLDFICSYKGYFIAIETKAGNKQPTARQEITMNEIRAAGGFVFLVNEMQGLAELKAYLEAMSWE
jgi:penicillin-binding protein-related factor A (putative recombinase)